MRTIATIAILFSTALAGCAEREAVTPEVVVGSVHGLTVLQAAAADPSELEITDAVERYGGAFAAQNGCIVMAI